MPFSAVTGKVWGAWKSGHSVFNHKSLSNADKGERLIKLKVLQMSFMDGPYRNTTEYHLRPTDTRGSSRSTSVTPPSTATLPSTSSGPATRSCIPQCPLITEWGRPLGWPQKNNNLVAHLAVQLTTTHFQFNKRVVQGDHGTMQQTFIDFNLGVQPIY